MGLIKRNEELLILPIAAIIEAEVLLEPFGRAPLDEPTFKGFVQYVPDLGVVKIDAIIDETMPPLAAHIVFIDDVKNIRPYFQCASCGLRCDLLVHDATLKCASDYLNYGLHGTKAKRRALLRDAKSNIQGMHRRRPKRWVPIEQSRQGVRYGDRYLPAMRASPNRWDDKTAVERPKPTVAPDSDYSTARARLLGRGAAQYEIFFQYLRESDEIILPLRKARIVFTPPEDTASTATTPELDIRLLRRAAWPKEADVRVFTLQYPDDHPLVIIDNRGFEPFIVVGHRWTDASDPGWQLIALDVQRNGRMRFICPVERRNFDKLYLRNGLFASRTAHRLTQESQRGSGRARTRMKQSKV